LLHKLYIEKTRGTPEVVFDPEQNTLILRGQSYPENAFKFYEPVLEWINQYFVQCNSPVFVEIKLSYINTSSSKCIMMLLEKFEEEFQKGLEVRLNWYYDEENESELECAEEFKEDVNFTFNIIPLQEEV
jgi:hypothetical protein